MSYNYELEKLTKAVTDATPEADKDALAASFKAFVGAMSFRDRYNFDAYVGVNPAGNIRTYVIGGEGRAKLGRLTYDLYSQSMAERIVAAATPGYIKVTVATRQKAFTFTAPERSQNFQNLLEGTISTYEIHGEEANSIRVASIIAAIDVVDKFVSTYRQRAMKDMKAKAIARDAETHYKKKPQRSGVGDFDGFISKVREQRKSREVIIPNFPLAPSGTLSSRTWGIEVETGGARGVNTPAGWSGKGDGSLRSAYTASWERKQAEAAEGQSSEFSLNFMDGHTNDREDRELCAWQSGCSSCDETRRANVAARIGLTQNVRSGDRYDTREFVSPILHSTHSRGLKKLLEQINTQPQNKSAGIHVHVGADDLNAKQIGSLIYGYNVIEPLLTASYRRGTSREYCRERDSYEIRRILDAAKKNPNGQANSVPSGDRYVTLNLQSLDSHNTVEFRALSGKGNYNYEYLVRWALICRELVNVAKAGVNQKEWNRIDSWEKLLDLFQRKGAETIDDRYEKITDDSISEAFKKNGSRVSKAAYVLNGGEI